MKSLEAHTLPRGLFQTDPIGYEDQINLYAYVANDPVNNTDPTGMFAEEENGGQLQQASPTPVEIVVAGVGPGIGHNGGPPLDPAEGRFNTFMRRIPVVGGIMAFFASSPAGDPNEAQNLRIETTRYVLSEIVEGGTVTTRSGANQSDISVAGRDIDSDFQMIEQAAGSAGVNRGNATIITLPNGVTITKYPSRTGPPTMAINPPGKTGPKIRYKP